MGITGASLYNAFGDKRSLYRRALAHYLETSVRDRVSRLEKLPPFPAIRWFFDEVIERSMTDKQRRGCMLVNAALELAPYDAEFQKVVSQEMVFIETFFRRCIAAGQKDGTISPARPPAELAKVLLSVLLGIRVLARTRPQRAVRSRPAHRSAADVRRTRSRTGRTTHSRSTAPRTRRWSSARRAAPVRSRP